MLATAASGNGTEHDDPQRRSDRPRFARTPRIVGDLACAARHTSRLATSRTARQRLDNGWARTPDPLERLDACAVQLERQIRALGWHTEALAGGAQS